MLSKGSGISEHLYMYLANSHNLWFVCDILNNIVYIATYVFTYILGGTIG